MLRFRSMLLLTGLALVMLLGGCTIFPVDQAHTHGSPARGDAYIDGARYYGCTFNGYGGGWYR